MRSVFLVEKEESMSQQAPPERILGIGILAGLIASLIISISARIIMRVVALNAHQLPGFSIAGTLRIIVIGVFVGFVPGFAYALCMLFLSNAPKVSKHLPGSIWRGFAFGLLLVVIVGLPSILISSPLLPEEDLNLGNPLLNRIMFAALPLLYGIALGGTEAILNRYRPYKPPSHEGVKSLTEGRISDDLPGSEIEDVH
jgi:hypothetical protein